MQPPSNRWLRKIADSSDWVISTNRWVSAFLVWERFEAAIRSSKLFSVCIFASLLVYPLFQREVENVLKVCLCFRKG